MHMIIQLCVKHFSTRYSRWNLRLTEGTLNIFLTTFNNDETRGEVSVHKYFLTGFLSMYLDKFNSYSKVLPIFFHFYKLFHT